MRILITGGNGFLGKHLVKQVHVENAEVLALSSRDADLTVEESLSRSLLGKFDVIYHLAAWTQAGDFCLYHAGEQWIRNQQINTNVVKWWCNHQPQAYFISIGTSCSYDETLPMSEENYLAGQPTESLFTYGMTKRMLWIGQKAMAAQFGLKSLVVVPSTLYGLRYHDDERQPHFIFDLTRKIVRAALFGEPVVLWGDGLQRREVVWVEDFVRSLVRLPRVCANEVVNVASGEDHSIREFAELICDLAGVSPSVIAYDTNRYVGAKAKKLDVSKVRTLLPDLKWTTLTQGLTWLVEEEVKKQTLVGPRHI